MPVWIGGVYVRLCTEVMFLCKSTEDVFVCECTESVHVRVFICSVCACV